MSVVDLVILGLVLPAVAAASMLLTAGVLGRRMGRPSWRRIGVPLAIGAGYLAGHLAIAWPSADVTDRVPFLVLAALAFGIAEAVASGPAVAFHAVRLLLSGLVAGLMIAPAFAGLEEAWGPTATRLQVATLAGLVVASWANLEALARRVVGGPLALPMAAIAMGAAVVLTASGTLILGRLVAVAAAALLAAWAASWRGEGLAMGQGGASVLVVVVAALVVEANVFAQVPGPRLALVALAPALLWLPRIGPLRRLKPWQAALIGTLAALVPIGIAVGDAIAGGAEDVGY